MQEGREVLIAGAGYTGTRIADVLHQAGTTVCVSTRASSFALPGIVHHVIDFDSDGVGSIAVERETTVIYLVPPDSQSETDTRIRQFFERVLNGSPDRLILISTTGVYGDCDGRWVDETSPLNPQTARARRRADMEQFATTWARRNEVQLVILRVAGIYGPGRIPVERVAKGLVFPPRSQTGYSNRIHVDDLVRVCVAFVQSNSSGTFNVADGNPTRMIDYMNLIADLWNLPKVIETSDPERLQHISPMMMEFLTESRKIDNKKLLNTLKSQLCYCDLRAGLESCRT